MRGPLADEGEWLQDPAVRRRLLLLFWRLVNALGPLLVRVAFVDTPAPLAGEGVR